MNRNMNLRRSPWLFIDTSVAGVCRVGILDGLRVRVREVRGRAGVLLPEIAKRASELGSIRGVCVVQGPGSFSSVRAGVLIANLIARVRRLPLVGVSVRDADDLSRLSERLATGTLSPVSFVEPVYDAEPNITIARTAS
jgi:hypothetical protein